MGKALYRKYRSKSLAEIVGQEHITRALDNALKQDKISHAYLFTGPKGVGKTSIARILAHEVNNFPYDESETRLDIIEIDAASNRRIDEVRDLRDKVHSAPTAGRYKVYIIDEVHMLTREAFNALLKTLEEPPAHVIFILATTEAHKLPETIISRTQHYAFRPVTLDKVTEHLQTIAREEKIDISPDALELIARHGEGSFRDSISLLDQVRTYGDSISLNDVEAVLGVAPEDGLRQLIASLSAGDAATVIGLAQALKIQGIDPSVIAKQLSGMLRQDLISGSATLPPEQILRLLEGLLAVPSSAYPIAALELALLGVVFDGGQVDSRPTSMPIGPETPKPSRPPTTESNPAVKTPKKATATTGTKDSKDISKAPSATTTVARNKIPASALLFDVDRWPEVLENIKKTHNTLYGVLRMANVSTSDEGLVLTFNFAFHQKRINDQKNKQVIIDAVEAVTGNGVILSCIVGEASAAKPIIAPKSDAPSSIEAISNIFGSAEVLES